MSDLTSDSVNIFVISIFILFILGLIWFVFRKKERFQRVLLLGCSYSGKTVLFSHLAFGKALETYTSMKENKGYFTNEKRRVEIVDIPGNERICRTLFDQYKNSLKGVIFVIDAESIQKEIRDVAEFMYNILMDPIIRSNCQEILIVCNKQDLNLAKGPAVVQMLLEKELSVLRNLKNKQLDSTDNLIVGKKKAPYLGSKKKDFEFTQIKPIIVNFTESVLIGNNNEVNFNDVRSWLNKF